MKCDICRQKEATIHFTEIIDDKKNELHICEECAKEKGIDISPENVNIDISNLISSIVTVDDDEAVENGNLRCKSCGINYKTFKDIGRFGCSDCYESFEPLIRPLLRKIHAAKQHVGKVPPSVHDGRDRTAQARNNERVRLNGELKAAIETENYEQAAALRDKIKKLK